MAQHLRPVVREVLDEREADRWLSAADAARYVYGCAGREDAFRKLRGRNATLDAMSQGRGRLRRWKRADLDRFLAENRRIERKRRERIPGGTDGTGKAGRH